MNVSEYIMERIAEEGVEKVFMVSGGGGMFLIEALGNNPKLQHVCNHHEQAVVMAAEGYQRATKNLGVALVTTGPAATNTLTGICCAWNDSIPLLVLTGQAKTPTLIGDTGMRQRGTHEVNIVPIVKSVTKYAVCIKNVKEVRYHLEKALYLTKNGRPGPVLLDIPLDIQSAEIQPDEQEGYIPEKIEYENKIDEVIAMLKQAKRPIILAGHGLELSKTEKFMLEIAEKYCFPVVTPKNGFEIIWETHPMLAGRIGINGQRAGNLAVQNADFILILGARLPLVTVGYETKLFAPNAKKVLVDCDKTQLEHCWIKTDLNVFADLKDFMPELAQKLSEEKFEYDSEFWVNKIQEYRKKYPTVTEEVRKLKEYVDSYFFFDVLSNYMTKDDVLVVDQGATFYSLTTAFKVKQGQLAFTNGGFSPMGYGLPASVGCCFAPNVRKVVSVNGDGGLQMNIQELQTIIHNNLDIKVFVFNNDGYLSIKHTQTNFFNGHLVGSNPESGVSCPDSIKIGTAYGFKTFRITNHKETAKVIEEVMQTTGPVLVEVMIAPMQPYYPKVTSKKFPDGHFESQPLDNMWPFLSEEEMKENMCND